MVAEHTNRTKTVTHAFASLAKDEYLLSIALSGAWGTGKTYLVKKFTEAHGETLQRAKLKFAYVSLFGVQSLAEVRTRLAAAAIETESRVSLSTLGKKLILKGLISGEAGGFDISKVGDIAK